MESLIWEAPDPVRELLDPQRFLRAQGIDPGRVDPERYFQKMPHFGETREEAARLIHPRALVGFHPVESIGDGRICLRGGAEVESRVLASLLASASEIILAVATVGDAVERRAEEYFDRGDSSRAFALDGWGTSALVSFGRALYRHLQKMAEGKGKNLSISFSPGHSDWPLEQQGVIFGLLPSDRIGVRLTDSYLMIPKKSTSMIAGLGEDVVSRGSKCDYCPRQKECLFRHE